MKRVTNLGSRERSDPERLDLLVIGTGAAGMAAAIRGAELGRRVAIVEDGTVGGTCVNVGCIPSKTLLAVAEAYHAAREGFPGVDGCGASVSWPDVRERKRELVASLRQSKYLDVLDAYPMISLLRGRAHFNESGAVEVAGVVHQAEKVVIATGTSPWLPPIAGLDAVDVLTSTTLMELDEVPASVIVLGGSAVGLELGQMLARFGVRITVLEMLPALLAGEDQDAALELRRCLEAEGLEIVTGAHVTEAARGDGPLVVRATVFGEERTFAADRILAATGRRANTSELGLDKAGVAHDANGFVRVDDGMRTSNADIFAAGDVTGGPGFVYVAAAGGRVAAENAVGEGGRTLDLRTVPRVTFTSPQVASVGIGPGEAHDHGMDVAVSRLGLEHVPRALVEHRTDGWIQVVAEKKTGRIVGVQAVGPHAAELLGEAALVVRLGLTIEQVTDTLHPYLTWVEGFKLAVQAFRMDVSKLSCCA
ncbi:MAG TPA: mercury(II) reductase [Gemmatimonadaceae bacterium]|nr:mercury(II) reductase [Gemmatimonadaceae bacterium]